MPATLYGIVNCDTVKRARAWLAEHDIDAAFHDFRKDGVPPARLDAWLAACGWERLLNRKGTAWRKLDEGVRDGVVDAVSSRAVMLAQPSVIKRPVVEWDADTVTVGFDPAGWLLRRAVRDSSR
jgi:Spx/MgsR family transcriptional regulator